TDARILEPHFGRWNIWCSAGTGPLSPFTDSDPHRSPAHLYLNSPTLVKGVNNDAPPGHATVTAFAPSPGTPPERGGTGGDGAKEKYAERLLDAIARRFIPGLKDHLGVVHLRTPHDNERILRAPQGNIYGRAFEPREVWTKLPFKGALPNLYFVGSYVSFA